MSDFYQPGQIITLHKLGTPSLERLESEVELYSKERPIALVLPSLYAEFERDAMKGIIKELRKVRYLREIVLALDKGTDAEFEKAKKFMSEIPVEVKIIHNEGKKMREFYSTLERNGLHAGEVGKGRSVWIASGYVLARGNADVIALHDCDIITYNREMLARLCYPVVNPNIDVVFCKGFYSRVTDRMHGRVTRLLITPLVKSLLTLLGKSEFLTFLDAFRYPLSGEFCMITDLARTNRIPWDWGLEVGTLAEVQRNYSVRRVAQVDISENYEHKHQPLSADDPSKGLMRMCTDICKSVFRTLAGEGVIFSEGFFKSLEVSYLRHAEDIMIKYEADAAINGLSFDRDEEARAIESFKKCIIRASEVFMENPTGTPMIPNWNRVTSAIPGVFDMLTKAVEDDNA